MDVAIQDAQRLLASHASSSNHTTSRVECRTMCPNIEQFPTQWPLWLIVIFYALVLIGSTIILFRGKIRRAMFRTALLSLQMVVCIIRIVVFSFEFHWQLDGLLMIAYSVPILLQFITSSILAVFLARCWFIMRDRPRAVPWLYFGTVVVWLALVTALFLFYYFCHNGCGSSAQSGFDHPVAFLSSVVFGLLTVAIFLAAWQMRRMLNKFILTEAMLRELHMVTKLLALFVIVFLARTLWSITYSADANVLQTKLNQLQDREDLTQYYFWVCIFFTFFEIIPATVLLWTFAHWSSRKVARLELEANGKVNEPTERTNLLH
eukprot:TRINITY_DN10423_c0_g1_i1.p1 TRINITY_DN10423_c0_g1~~TRINITY_DN10423_c0_g1_i1.p1  ORF type:complete len:320 (+),score=42.10 TRINITY_DN10423_c0_g1_i1:110-1069(+)